MNKEIEEIIKRYEISAEKDYSQSMLGEFTGRIRILNVDLLRKDEKEECVKAKKQEILDYLRGKEEEKNRKWIERRKKIEAIPGLKELQLAMDDLEEWKTEFDASFSDVGGLGVRKKPEYNFKEMYEKYPVAHAYLKAEELAYKSNDELSEIGFRALERIIEGENYKMVLADMEREEKEFVQKHVWD